MLHGVVVFSLKLYHSPHGVMCTSIAFGYANQITPHRKPLIWLYAYLFRSQKHCFVKALLSGISNVSSLSRTGTLTRPIAAQTFLGTTNHYSVLPIHSSFPQFCSPKSNSKYTMSPPHGVVFLRSSTAYVCTISVYYHNKSAIIDVIMNRRAISQRKECICVFVRFGQCSSYV